MVQINFATREVQCKVVYYGPPRSGKTANLRSIHERTPAHVRGQLTSIATDTDRTLYFDFLPLDLGQVAKVRAKIQLYAVPYLEGQNTMRVLVLEGVDGVVFVADAARDRMDVNAAALANLKDNLRHIGRDPATLPIVFQWNRSDLPDAAAAEELERRLNPEGHPSFLAVAHQGSGVLGTLKAVTQAVLVRVAEAMEYGPVAAEPEPEPETQAQAVADEPPRPVIRPTALTADPLPLNRPDGAPEPEAAPVQASLGRVPLPEPDEEEAVAEEDEVLPALGSMRRTTSFEEVALPPADVDEPAPEPVAELFEAPPEPEPERVVMAPPRAPAPPLDTPEAPSAPQPPAAGDPWQERKTAPVPIPLRAPAMADAAREGDFVTIGRPRRQGWVREEAPPAEVRLREGPSPVVDRRRHSRHDQTTISNAALAAGALFAVVGLSAVGYLVHALL